MHQTSMKTSISKIDECLPDSDSFLGRKIASAKKRVKSGEANLLPPGFSLNEKGQEFINVPVSQSQDVNKELAEAELRRHGNDPNTRLDECDFPSDRKDRKFILSHNFGPPLDFILKNIRQTWVYIYGDAGRGKTSIAIRAVWEMIKNDPTQKATFLSVGKWTDSLMFGKTQYLEIDKLKKVVVIDDFDKFDKQKNFQVRQLLILIEELKNKHFVIITSNQSLKEMARLSQYSVDLEVMLDRIKGKSIIMDRFTGESYR